jgi:DNA-binding transcriptional LysR family regulator
LTEHNQKVCCRRMELRHLRYFVAAAQAQNVSRAALKLHVSQPALSRQIHDLEEELGFALFERSAKSVHLTEAGKTLLGEARAVLQRADDAVKAARAVAVGGGELHVGYAPSPLARVLPRALRAFQAEFPKVKVKLHDLSSAEMLAGVREGGLALALMVRPNKKLLQGLRFEEVARDSMCLAVPPNHPYATLPSVTISQASGEPLVVFNSEEYPDYGDTLVAVFGPNKGKLKIVEEHDSAASLITAIESGAGAAVVPESFSCMAGLRLKLLPLTPPPAPLVIGAVCVTKKLMPAAEKFIQSAKSSVSTSK